MHDRRLLSLREAGPRLNTKAAFPGIRIAIIKMRRLSDCLIFIMGIPILVKQHLFIETAPCS